MPALCYNFCNENDFFFIWDQATKTSVQGVVLSWSPPSVSSQCVVRYIIQTTTSAAVITTENNTTEIKLEPSAQEHSVKIVGVDYANQTGEYSRVKKFVYNGKYNEYLFANFNLVSIFLNFSST